MKHYESVYHHAALLDFSAPLTGKERELLRAARYRIEVRLGERSLPASEQDIAADAYAARTADVA